MKYRSRTEIVAMILDAVRTGATKTKIMYKAYLSYTQLTQYMSFLIENKLIERQPGSDLYILTENGMKLLHLSKELDDMISLKKGHVII